MRGKILEILKNSNGFVSGEEISEKIGISRTSVWKHINTLRKQGYEIDSVTNRGYRLVSGADRLTADEIKPFLKTRYIGRNIVYYESTDSTNMRAKENAGEPDGTVFVAEYQEKGRGRLSKSWESEPMSGIYMTILLKPEIAPGAVSQITLIAGLAAAMAVENITKEQAMIKWPNDIVLNGRKICGILTELTAEENCINYIIAGIGINVNTKEFDEDIKEKATSIMIETGKKCGRAPLLAEVLNEFEKLYTIFLKDGFIKLKQEYSKRCITIGREVQIITPSVRYSARAEKIDDSGCLIVKRGGVRETVNSGEVSVRGVYGYI